MSGLALPVVFTYWPWSTKLLVVKVDTFGMWSALSLPLHELISREKLTCFVLCFFFLFWSVPFFLSEALSHLV